jgi:hypothetical protein
VSSPHGPIHWTAGRVTSLISGLLYEPSSKSDTLINVNFELSGVHAMDGTVSRLLFTAETQVQSHDLFCISITSVGRASCVYSTARNLGLWQGYMTTCISAFFLYWYSCRSNISSSESASKTYHHKSGPAWLLCSVAPCRRTGFVCCTKTVFNMVDDIYRVLPVTTKSIRMDI